VQVCGVRHEREHDTSEDLATAVLLTATMDSLIVVRRVMGEILFVHCREEVSVQAQLGSDGSGQCVASVDGKTSWLLSISVQTMHIHVHQDEDEERSNAKGRGDGSRVDKTC
jgi:hypothetical protein